MQASRPYLIRALYEWMQNNEQVPYISVDAEYTGVVVPSHAIENGQVVLNIAASAVQALLIDNEAIHFNARFSGQPMQVYIPLGAVLAIYSQSGEGMGFGMEPGATVYRQPEPPTPQRPQLKRVK